jgi:hypothetical protein
MAKQKLTPAKRIALRTELKSQLSAGVERSEILKSLSAKYGITTEGLRWYLNAESPSGSARKARTPKKARATKTAKAKTRRQKPAKKGPKRHRAKRAYTRKPSSNGHALHLPKVLGELTEKALKGLLAAKRLVPRLEAATRRERELKAEIRSLSGEVRAERTKARRIQGQIKRLARV